MDVLRSSRSSLSTSAVRARSLAFAVATGFTASDRPEVEQTHLECQHHGSAADHAAASREAIRLSRAHWSKSDFPQALPWAEIAVDEALFSGDAPQRGRSLHWLGNLFHIMGDLDRALEVYEEAEQYMASGDRIEHARMKGYRAWYLDAIGSQEAAVQLYEAVLELAREAGADGLIRATACNLAELAIRRAPRPEDLQKAERYLEEARATLRGEQPRPGLLLHEAMVARAKGDLDRADEILSEAAARSPSQEVAWQIDCQRGLVAAARGKLQEAARWYREAIRVVEELSRDAEPASVQTPFLQARWEPYQRLLALQHRQGDAEGALATIVRAQGRMFVDALAVRAANDARRRPVRSGLAPVDELQRVVALLQTSALVGSVPAQEIQTALRTRQVRQVLVYFADKERMRLVVVVDGQPRLTAVDVELHALAALIDRFRADPGDPWAAAELGSAILPETALPVTRGERIHIIPTGKLITVSFAALQVADERLIERHEVVLAPSVVWLAGLSGRASFDNRDRVVMADSRSDLQRARSELSTVVERTDAAAYMEEEVNGETLRSAAGSSLLHVIAHSASTGRGGHLALTGGDIGAAEILEWDVDPRLVVLPTCGSAATGRVEMWDSLAAAFLAAGSRNVVATLTSVEDPVAAEFTDLFYLHGGVDDPVGATRRAQRELGRSHPASTWSAFVATGL